MSVAPGLKKIERTTSEQFGSCSKVAIYAAQKFVLGIDEFLVQF